MSFDMGTVVPEDWPELEDAKFYCASLDTFGEFPFDQGCGTPFLFEAKCCMTGAVIKAWRDAGFECVNFHSLCGVFAEAAQRMTCIMGPYDGIGACQAEC